MLVFGVAVGFLVVGNVVLGAAAHTGRLKALDKGHAGLGDQLRVFPIHLIVPAAQRVAGNVDVGPEADVNAGIPQLPADSFPNLRSRIR